MASAASLAPPIDSAPIADPAVSGTLSMSSSSPPSMMQSPTSSTPAPNAPLSDASSPAASSNVGEWLRDQKAGFWVWSILLVLSVGMMLSGAIVVAVIKDDEEPPKSTDPTTKPEAKKSMRIPVGVPLMLVGFVLSVTFGLGLHSYKKRN